MSTYTTGELARLCGVTVRTVQYYDTRGILIPTQLSEGGRRLYSEEDVGRMKIICFLRELGLSINAISQFLSEEDPESVLFLLMEQQKQELEAEIAAQQGKLEKLNELKRRLKDVEKFSVESIGDIAYQMENKKILRKIHRRMLLAALPVSILQATSIILWIVTGIWWPFLVWAVVYIPCGVWISRYYYQSTAYICPECHKVFKPRFREAFWARHTPTLRKLTCTNCGKKSWCVETCAEEMKKQG